MVEARSLHYPALLQPHPGTRYGASLRKQIKKMEVNRHSKYFCEFCGKYAVKRKAVGIWGCKDCGKVKAGGFKLYNLYHERKKAVGISWVTAIDRSSKLSPPKCSSHLSTPTPEISTGNHWIDSVPRYVVPLTVVSFSTVKSHHLTVRAPSPEWLVAPPPPVRLPSESKSKRVNASQLQNIIVFRILLQRRKSLPMAVGGLLEHSNGLCVVDHLSMEAPICSRNLRADKMLVLWGLVSLSVLVVQQAKQALSLQGDAHSLQDGSMSFYPQVRSKLSTFGFGQPTEGTCGGNALKFFTSMRLNIRRTGFVKKGKEFCTCCELPEVARMKEAAIEYQQIIDQIQKASETICHREIGIGNLCKWLLSVREHSDAEKYYGKIVMELNSRHVRVDVNNWITLPTVPEFKTAWENPPKGYYVAYVDASKTEGETAAGVVLFDCEGTYQTHVRVDLPHNYTISEAESEAIIIGVNLAWKYFLDKRINRKQWLLWLKSDRKESHDMFESGLIHKMFEPKFR
ncbi:hypothetical protein GQ457_14G020410 [Hibiscus cannabinus]